MPETGARPHDFAPSPEIHSPDELVADLVGRLAPTYLPQVQGIAVQSVVEIVEAGMAQNRLTTAEDVLILLRQTVELYQDLTRAASGH